METKEKNRTAARKRPAQRPASGTNTQATAEAKASRRPVRILWA